MLIRIYLIGVIAILGNFQCFGQEINKDSLEIAIRDSLTKIMDKEPLRMEILEKFGWTPFDTTDFVLNSHDHWYYLKSGNPGSPIQSKRDQIELSGGIDEGIHHTDHAHQRANQLQLLRPTKPFSEVLVSQSNYPGSSQSGLIDNLFAKACVAIPMRKNIFFNFNYDRINYKGIYVHNRNFVSSLSSSLFWESKDKRNRFEFNLASNTDKLEHNNGISSDTVLSLPDFRIRESIPVNSNEANSRTKDGQIGIRVKHNLLKNSKGILNSIDYSLYYHYNNHFFNDNKPIPSLKWYGQSYYLDSNIVRRAYRSKGLWAHTEISLLQYNGFQLSSALHWYSYEIQHDSAVNESIQRFSNTWNAGYRYHNLYSGVRLGWGLQQDKPFSEMAVDFQLKTRTGYQIHGSYGLTNELPSILQQRLHINRRNIWLNTFKNTSTQNIKIAFTGRTHFWPSLEIQYLIYNNMIYLDSSLIFIQSDKLIQHFKLKSSGSWKYKFISSAHEVHFHLLSPDPMGWSAWSSKHDLGFNIHFFSKNNIMRIAPQVKIYRFGSILNYHPITGQYYRLEKNLGQSVIFIPGVSLSMKIESFHFMLQLDQVDSFWNKQRPQWIYNQPIYDFGLNASIQWKFIN